MAERIALGIDPDTKNTAWALVDAERILSVGVIRRTKNTEDGMLRLSAIALEALLKGRRVDVVVVEGQEIYTGSSASPNDLITLAQIAGGLAGQITVLCPSAQLVLPKPRTWKGQTPKPIDHARSLSKFGILYEQREKYSLPAGCAKSAKIFGADKLRDTDWFHVGDAVGLAVFGRDLLQ